MKLNMKMIKQVGIEEFFKFYKGHWDKVYKTDTTGDSPIISTLEFHRKAITGTPFWSMYCETFCTRKVKLIGDFFKVPEEQKIAFYGPHLFMINAAPLCHYHSMFLPYFKEKKEQEISRPEELYLNIELLMASKDPTLRIFFNSLKAGASMNHLHYHLVSSKGITGEDKLPIEKGDSGIPKEFTSSLNIHKRTQDMYILPHFVLKATKPMDKDLCKTMANTAYNLIEAIKTIKKAYNVIISEEGSSLYVIPRNELTCAKMGNGAIECSGVVICSNSEVFRDTDQKMVTDHLKIMSINNEELDEIENIFAKS